MPAFSPLRVGLVLLVLASARSAAAQAWWPQFLGPQGDGHSKATGLPLTWSESENVVWKTPIHGRGWSSPVIWGDQIWLTTATPDGKKRYALCVDRKTGKILRDLLLFTVEKPQEIHTFNSYASPSPVLEKGRAYVTFGSVGTAAIDTVTGKVLWTRDDLPCNHWRGAGSSPILYENLLIMHFDGYDYQYIVALDKQTGKTVWKRDRGVDYGTDNGDFMKAFCTPIVIRAAGREQLISPCAKAALSYDPRTGEELWRVRFDEHSATARPLFGHGLVYINTGFGKAQLLAVKPNGKGDVTYSHVAWRQKKGVPSKPSQLLIGDLIYMVHDRGVATCLEAKTGEIVWRERVGGHYTASPLYADGRIYLFDEEGKTTVIAPGREYKQLAENHLDSGFMASPATADGGLYLRTEKALYRIEK